MSIARADEPSTRERILAHALPLFAEHGFAGTSVRLIAQAAQVNVATLAYHFADKEGLYAACVERLYEDLSALDPRELDAAGDPLEALVRLTWRFARAHRVHVRLLHRHLLDRGRHHDLTQDRWLEPLLERVEPLLGSLQPGWSVTERRLLVFSAMHLVVRFVLDDPEQLAHTLRVPPDRLDDALVRWLTDLVRGLLRGVA